MKIFTDYDKKNFRIVDFLPEYGLAVKQLNLDWIEAFFWVEPIDFKVLSNPKEEIIDKGGFVFCLIYQNEVLGTASLLKKTENVFELTKMAVSPTAQGMGLGSLLMEHCIAAAKKKNMDKLILFSNTKLTAAISLYRKFGFVEVALEPGIYTRSDIKMEKTL